MNKVEIVKAISEVVVSFGVGSLVGNAIKLTTDPEAGKFKKFAIGIGGFVLSNMISDAASKYTGDRIDQAATSVSRLFAGPEDLDVKSEVTESDYEAPSASFPGGSFDPDVEITFDAPTTKD